jgi:cation-transporting ATPase 13A2
MSESVPSSVTGFANRRSRADSVASFTYFEEDDDSPEYPSDEAIIDESDDELDGTRKSDYDLESGSTSPTRRKSSGYSRISAEDPLLYRHDSTMTDASGYARHNRTNQKIYVVTEDLTLVVAGFKTKPLGFAMYIILCTITLGLCYLLLRWLPRWRVWLTGSPKPLRSCSWVVVEVRLQPGRKRSHAAAKVGQNQWGEFAIQDIEKVPYGYSLSTVFGATERRAFHEYDDDDDPVMTELQFLNYRYIRFCYQPLKDKFVPCSNWKDPAWTDIKSIRTGLDIDERSRREQVFGKNEIEIQQKSIPQLLVDEVRLSSCSCGFDLHSIGVSSLLRLSSR